MLQVYICVGSSCHLRGSYYIIKAFQEMIKKNGLDNRIEIKASFCLGRCTSGVSVKVDDEYIGGFTPGNVEQMFKDHIMSKLK